MLLGTTALHAHDVEIDGIYYNLDTETKEATVTYKGESTSSQAYSGTVAIPSTIESGGVTYTVTSIGEYNQEIKGKTNVEIIPVIA